LAQLNQSAAEEAARVSALHQTTVSAAVALFVPSQQVTRTEPNKPVSPANRMANAFVDGANSQNSVLPSKLVAHLSEANNKSNSTPSAVPTAESLLPLMAPNILAPILTARDMDVGPSPFLTPFSQFLEHLETVFTATVTSTGLSSNFTDLAHAGHHPLVLSPLLSAWRTISPSRIAPLYNKPNGNCSVDLASCLHVVCVPGGTGPFSSALLTALARYRSIAFEQDPTAAKELIAPHLNANGSSDTVLSSLSRDADGFVLTGSATEQFARLCAFEYQTSFHSTSVTQSRRIDQASSNSLETTTMTTTATTTTTTVTTEQTICSSAFAPVWLTICFPDPLTRFQKSVSFSRNLARCGFSSLVRVAPALAPSSYVLPWQTEPSFLLSGLPDAHLTDASFIPPENGEDVDMAWHKYLLEHRPWGGMETFRDETQAWQEAVASLPPTDDANPAWYCCLKCLFCI
jgi:hypothetical protein